MSVKTTGIVRFTLDDKDAPALTRKAKARLAALPDRNVDLTDIPATHGVAWKSPGPLISGENKQQISLRIDADVLAYFKKTGRRYQTRMNEVLRWYMNAQRAETPRGRGR
jgi:uncharacterized protein (DUF4415 family)